jgi:hypothetical protein
VAGCAVALVVSCVQATSAAPAAGVEFTVSLSGALFLRDAPVADGPTLVLDVSRTGDRWERVWGFAGDFHINSPHPGRVVSGTVLGDAVKLALEMDIQSGSWATGGRARYDVSLRRQNDGGFAGTFTGEFRGTAVSGKASATLKPAPAASAPGFLPPQPGEHPRLLFCRSDLPALREKAKTPLGQAALAKMGWSNEKEMDVVGLGVKYQLTSERAFATQAIAGVEQLMRAGLHCDQYGNNVGDRAEKMALAFDLCHDAWPEEFRRRVRRYLLFIAHNVWHHQRKLNQGINWHFCSNWSAPIHSGLGMSGLALWGEPGEAPPKPTAPNSGAEIPPAADYRPGRGVPVVRFQSDAMPGDWICASPLPWEEAGDALAALGGLAKARPEAGTSVSFAGRTETFRALTRETNGGYWTHETLTRGQEALDITICSRRVNFSQSYFFTVISNDAPRWVRIATTFGGATAYVNGVALRDGEAAHLAPGLYPLLLHARLDWCNSWGHVPAQPRFIEITAAEAQAITAARQVEFAQEMRDWEFDLAEWKRLGGVDIAGQRLFEASRLTMRMLVENAIGAGGFQAEVGAYGNIASKPALHYAAPYRRMFGVDLTPEPDFEVFLSRKMFAHAYGAGGRTLAQEINSSTTIDLDNFAAVLPVVPEAWKPAVLWGWQQHARQRAREAGRDEQERETPPLAAADGSAPWAAIVAESPVLTFLNYPLDLEARPPQGLLPLTWQAPTFGYYGFRNAWAGADDFIVQVFLKARHIGGWNGENAGTFRVLGLGQTWAHGPTDRSRSRWEECVVWLPEDDINLGACARLTRSKFEPDGSGVVTFDLGDVYATVNPAERGRKSLYERYGGLRRASAFADTGITGTRSIAVDYSGRSGAPCLLAIADRIRGGKSKVWVWQLGQAAGKNPANDLSSTRVDGHTFTITKGDATLRGTFLLPKNVKLSAEVREKSMVGGAASVAGKVLQRPIAGVFAEGGDEFLVVVTVQRGTAPEVRVEGERAHVGARVVFFVEGNAKLE